MKIIECLSKNVSEEISDAKKYARMALEQKDARRGLADTLYSLSQEEMRHMNMLHDEIEKLIDEYRRAKGDPPADMMAVYEYLHNQNIDAATEVKMMQQLYKG